PAVNGLIGVDEGCARLAPLGIAYIAVLLLGSGLRYAQTMLASYVGQRAMYDLRVQLFAHLESLSLSFFDRNPVGRLMTRITNDIDALTDMVTQGVVAIFGDVVVIVVIALVLAILDWRLALVTYASLPILIAMTMYFRRMMRESFRAIRIRLARVNAYLNENISGMAILQLFTREQRSFKDFDALNTDLLNANQGGIRAMALFIPSVQFTRAGRRRSATPAGAGARARRDHLRERELRVQRGRPCPSRCELQDLGGRKRRDRRRHRGGEDLDHQPHLALLRRAEGVHPAGRRR